MSVTIIPVFCIDKSKANGCTHGNPLSEPVKSQEMNANTRVEMMLFPASLK
jgi:hypothetical protein